MAYPDSPSVIVLTGQANLAGDEEALFKDDFIPEVQMLYKSKCVLDGIFPVKNIRGSKSHTFPSIGRTEVDFQLARGQFLQSRPIEHAETTITIDRPEYAKVALDRGDGAMTRLLREPEYRKRLAEAKAAQTERNRICELIKTARSAHDLTSEVGGTVLSGVDLTTPATLAEKGEALYQALEAGIQVFREKDIEDDLYVLLTYQHRTWLHNFLPLINKDYGGSGNTTSEGFVQPILGLNILFSNHANKVYGNNVTDTVGNKHDVDATNTVGTMFTGDALQELELIGETYETIDDPDHLEARIQVSSYRGYGRRDPRCSLELSSATS